MASLVNRYHFSEPVTLSGVAKIADGASFFVIGNVGSKGFYGVVRSDGVMLWGRTLAVADRSVGMINIVPASNGDFLLYGCYAIGNNRLRHLLLRVGTGGQTVWQHEIHTSNSRLPVRLVENSDAKPGKGIYPFTLVGWYNKTGLIDTFEFRHLNESGEFLQQAQSIGDIHALGDNQITTGCLFDYEPIPGKKVFPGIAGLALGGGTTFFGGYIPYLVLGNEKFQQRVNYTLNFKAGKFDGQIDRMLYDAELGLLIIAMNRWPTGSKTKDGNTIVLALIPVHTQPPALLQQTGASIEFKLADKEERVRKIMRHGNLFYAVVNAADNSYCAIVRFRINEDSQIELVDSKKFVFGNKANIADLVSVSSDRLALVGSILNKDGGADEGFFILTDPEMKNCVTQNMPLPLADSIELGITLIDPKKLYDPKVPDTAWTEEQTAWTMSEPSVQTASLCPSREFELETAHALQSAYLNLQAAGSLGQDSSPGIHLRWFLLNYLGDRHLPKGNYASNTANFNRQNDFVFLYCWPYEPHAITVNFKNKPAFIDEYRKIWTYQVSNRLFYLYFHDKNKYNSVRSTVNPATDAYGFLAQYHPAPLELRLRDELFFAGSMQMSVTSSYTLFLETHSVAENTAIAPRVVSSSTEFNQLSGPVAKFREENIRSLYFSLSGGNVDSVNIETYSDAIFIPARNKTMEFIGPFALTKDTPEAYLRLEDPSRFQVHGSWLKFNDGALVNVPNYQQRWHDPVRPNASLLHGVDSYIQLSDNPANPLAIATLPADAPDTDTPPVESSYLDLLQLVSTDFHNARMLGLGYIDTPPAFRFQESAPAQASVSRNQQHASYLYLIEYITEADLNNGQGPGRLQHLYLSLPTSMKDQRLPLSLEINALNYGLYAQQNTPSPILLTDTNGYTPDGQSRYINVFTRLPYDYSLYPGLLPPQKQYFSFAKFSFPVFAGMEYRKQGEGAWRAPEIAHEDIFTDTTNVAETTPLIIQDNKPTLIHREQEEGIHEYAPYAINIFSRASQLGNTVPTDLTHFVRRNTLLPPSEFHVQLIQRENPLLLTTLTEQDLLTHVPIADKTLVRITFNYHHIHDRAYDFGNRVRIFFRPETPRAVIGGVESIQDIGATEQNIQAASFTYASSGEIKVPDIPNSLRPNFLGSVLAVDGKLFNIDDITYDSGNTARPILRILKNEERAAQTSGGQATLSQQFIGLNSVNDPGKPFMLVENMSQPANWGPKNPLSFEIEIGDPAQWTTRNDSHINSNGDTVSYALRGIWAQANISSVSGTNGADGVYHLKFPGFQLNHHPQYNAANPVEWHKGVVRIGFKNGPNLEKKVLKVTAIYQIGNGQDLELDVYDDAYNSADFDLTNAVEVNFYPGYKAYFYYELAKGFTENVILPATDEGYRNTLMGACSLDTGNSYHSPVGTPAILMAQEIIEPAIPDQPQGPLYATLPDWYNKATYTFSVQLQHTPYAVIFYRADLNALLYALYKSETVQLIKDTLPPAADDVWFTSRWQDLLNFPTGVFADYPTGSGTYRFPKPDKTGVFDGTLEPGATPAMAEKVRNALHAAFLPLTKTPILYKDMQNITTLTAAKPAKIVGNTVQFTDFTIDGSMITSYFYCAREMGNRMDFSRHSAIAGPVQLVNTAPPPAPVVQKMTVQLNDPYTGVSSAVVFKINDFPGFDRITKVQIFRADSAVDALSVRTMKMAKEIDLSSLTAVNNLYTLEDSFQDLPEVPYGDPLYYRIVSIREVPCKDVWNNDIIKYVPSYPTKVFLANVVDNVNPEPPAILVNATNQGNKLTSVQLSWNKTTYKGTYYLYKLTSAGQWSKIMDIPRNNDPLVVVDLLDTTLATDELIKEDADGNVIYHRFKVTVESTSGLLNLYELPVTV